MTHAVIVVLLRFAVFEMTVLEDDAFEYCLAGHLETGKDSFSDPLMGGLV